MVEPRVEFRDVRKVFRLRNRSDSLRDTLVRTFRGLTGAPRAKAARFVALDGVSFSVAQAEVVGIVGANGAGKSTSLRLAAGVYSPDSGDVVVRGRVSAMIELSAGFHPDLSGAENVYLAGALLGLRRKEVAAVFDRIAEFADIGEFLDSPVHMYSSGMAVRLGFSVAAHVPADVLLVDEVLAVGDLDFQTKCLRRMQERRAEGVSIIFVSHNLAIVEQFCDRVVFLQNGRVLADGPPREAIDAYRRRVGEHQNEKGGREVFVPNMRTGTGDVVLDQVRIGGEPGTPPGSAFHGGSLRVSARWRVIKSCGRPVFGVAIYTIGGGLLAESTSNSATAVPENLEGEGRIEILVPDLRLLPGDYEISLYVKDRDGFMALDYHQRLYPLRVLGSAPAGEHGVVGIGGQWTMTDGRT